MKEFKCRDMGYDCDYRVQDQDDGEAGERRLVNQAVQHGRDQHRLQEHQINNEFREKIRSRIRPSTPSRAA
jgi:predicted small metal-binding protein